MTVGGNLSVAGTTTTINTTNLSVDDQLILLNSVLISVMLVLYLVVLMVLQTLVVHLYTMIQTRDLSILLETLTHHLLVTSLDQEQATRTSTQL